MNLRRLFMSPEDAADPNVTGLSDSFDWSEQRVAPRAPQMSSPLGQLAAGAYNGAVAPAMDFMASPQGMALSAVPALGPLASRGLAALFAPVAFKNAAEATGRAKEAILDPNASLQDKVTPIADALSQGAMAVGASTHAIPAPNLGRLGIVPEGMAPEAPAAGQDARFAELDARHAALERQHQNWLEMVEGNRNPAFKEATSLVQSRIPEAGYDPGWYHGTSTKRDFTVPQGHRGVAAHVTKNIAVAKDFAEDRAGADRADEKLLRLAIRGEMFDPSNSDHIARVSEQILPEADARASMGSRHHGQALDDMVKLYRNPQDWQEKGAWDTFETRAFQDAIKKAGFDGYLDRENFNDRWGSNAAVFNPSNLKLADAFTYDDAGKLIPLSQRFNWNNPDIRYMAPAALGLGALMTGALSQGNGQQ